MELNTFFEGRNSRKQLGSSSQEILTAINKPPNSWDFILDLFKIGP
jgi:hypothetical protein